MTSGTGEKPKGGRRGSSRLRRRSRCAPESVNDTYVDTNKFVDGAEKLSMPVQIPSYGSSSSSSNGSPENDVAAMMKEELFRDGLDVKVPREEVVWSHGCVSVIGRRREMEDAARVEVGFATGALLGDRYDYFGVYDGHGGVQVAAKCRDRLHRMVKHRVEAAEGLVEWEEVMAGSFGEMDKEVLKTGGEEEKTVGSIALVAVVGREVVVVANCGDSRAVIYRGGEAVALSDDHKPNRPDELERIEAAGGRVINWNGHRILGVLATSRSIGDQYLKPFVIPEPEVTVMERTNADEFLILASDGLWDVISNEFACRVVKRCLEGRIRRRHDQETEEKDKAVEAAALLVELAMSRGSRDNITVIVIELNKQARTFS